MLPNECCGVMSVPSKDGMELGMREATLTVLLGALVLELLWKGRQMRFSYCRVRGGFFSRSNSCWSGRASEGRATVGTASMERGGTCAGRGRGG